MVPFGVSDDGSKQCDRAGDPQGCPLGFQLSSLHHWPTADPMDLWHSWACILTFLTGTLVFTTLAPSRASERQETMMGREQMPHVKVSRERSYVSPRGVSGLFYLHQSTCFRCHHSGGASTKLPSAQPERRGCLLLGLQSGIFSFSHHPPCPLKCTFS